MQKKVKDFIITIKDNVNKQQTLKKEEVNLQFNAAPTNEESIIVKSSWSFWQVILTFAVVYVCTLLLQVFFLAMNIEMQTVITVCTLAQQIMLSLFPIIIVCTVYHYDLGCLGFHRVKIWTQIPMAFIVGIGCYLLSVILMLIINFVYPYEVVIQVAVQELLAAKTTFQFVMLIIITAVFAPIAEEIFFRGFLYGSLRYKLSKIPAALISGALFSAVHFDLFRFLPFAFFGFILALFYEKYHNIYLNMLIHAGFNSFSILLLFLE